MSLKKLLILSAVAVSPAILAGGHNKTEADMPAAPVVDSGYYFGSNVGYAFQNYHEDAVWTRSSSNTGVGQNSADNRKGGFSGGIDMGYRINNHVAIELGWFWLPEVNVNTTSDTTKAWMQSWVAYIAGKFIAPLCSKTDAFFKVGAEYRNVEMPANASVSSGGTITDRKSDYVRPMFAVGLSRDISSNFSAVVQYAYFMGDNSSFQLAASNSGSLGTVSASVVTAGLTYEFTV